MNCLSRSAAVILWAAAWPMLILTNTAVAQVATSDTGPLRVSLEVRNAFPSSALSGASLDQEQVALTLENNGDHAFPIPESVEQIWKVTLHKEGPDQEPIQWRWSVTSPRMASLQPGQTLRLEGAWDIPKNVEPGTYVIETEFIPTSEKQTANFVIYPSLTREVLFTGKLMGYYRLPDQQSFSTESPDKPCIPPGDGKGRAPSADAQVFIDHYRQRARNGILVGTGDNFAPNYYSRVLVNAERKPGEPSVPNKELYDWDSAAQKWVWYQDTPSGTSATLEEGMGTIPRDNVGCLLSYLHYDAIVPGKHDFYYGPERLRELARFMASIPEDENFRPVQMLAANMMIRTTWVKDHVPIPDTGKRPLPFVTKYAQTPPPKPDPNTEVSFHNLEIDDFTDGGFAFPWMQFVRVTTTGWDRELVKTRLQVFLCEAAPGNPDDFLSRGGFCNNQHLLVLDPGATNAAGSDKPPKSTDDSKVPQTLVYRIPAVTSLSPGRNYAICIPAPEITVEKNRNDDDARKAPPYCFRFSVYNPFFQFPTFGNPGRSATYRDPQPYVLRDEDGEAPVVIFGVVAPELLEHIGGDNFAWKTVRGLPGSARRDKRYTTKLTISDPVRSLVHLEDYFEKQYAEKHPGQDFHGIRVLLAQMPPDEAKDLAEHLPACLRFDLIITEADDALATPNQVLDIHPSTVQGGTAAVCHGNVGMSGLTMRAQFVNGALAKPSTMVAVPPSHQQSPSDHLSRLLQVRDLNIREDGHSYWNYALSGDPISVPVPDTTTLTDASNAFWLSVCQTLYPTGGAKQCQVRPVTALDGTKSVRLEMIDSTVQGQPPATVPWDTQVKNAAIQQLALWTIRERWNADVALLQERDFYSYGLDDYLADHCDKTHGPPPERKYQCVSLPGDSIDVQEVLDRILWKGDYIKILSVQGSILKSVLKQSDQFHKIEKAAYLSVNETGRPLVRLGLRPDLKNGGDFLVNARPLDPAALYTVATSDYIALGDTGYPDIAAPPVGDPPAPTSSSVALERISGSTCSQLKRATVGVVQIAKNCRITIDPRDYYDELANRIPDDPRKGNTSWYKFYAWTFFHADLGQPDRKNIHAPPGPDDISAQMQGRAEAQKSWDFTADKLSIGFSGLAHSNSEQTLSQQFAGVQNAQVNAKHSHTWDWDANSKFTVFHPMVDWFTSETLQYSSNFVSQVSGPRSETQSRNQFAVDGGPYLHLLSRRKDLPQLSLVPSAHFETQVGNPIANLNLSAVPPSTNSLTLTFHQGRTNLLLGRLGLRFQDRKSYVEGGLEGGKTLNAIQQFNVLTAPGGPSVPCMLEASLSLTKCLNNFNKSHPLTPVTPSSTVSVVRHPQDRYGAYWTMGVTVPINQTISYNFQESSDYFFLSRGDNSADTRFRHQLIHTLKFSVFPNLSFEPTYTIFLYENKLDYHFLLQQQYTVKINYSFDWSNGHETRRQLQYKKPSSQ